MIDHFLWNDTQARRKWRTDNFCFWYSNLLIYSVAHKCEQLLREYALSVYLNLNVNQRAFSDFCVCLNDDEPWAQLYFDLFWFVLISGCFKFFCRYWIRGHLHPMLLLLVVECVVSTQLQFRRMMRPRSYKAAGILLLLLVRKWLANRRQCYIGLSWWPLLCKTAILRTGIIYKVSYNFWWKMLQRWNWVIPQCWAVAAICRLQHLLRGVLGKCLTRLEIWMKLYWIKFVLDVSSVRRLCNYWEKVPVLKAPENVRNRLDERTKASSTWFQWPRAKASWNLNSECFFSLLCFYFV